MRRLLGLIAAGLLACAVPALARPLDLEDLLQTQDLGAVGLTPSGSTLIVERLRAYAGAPAFDTEADLTIGRTDLLRFDLTLGAAPEPLLPVLADGGYKAGPLSPDGAHLLVYRLRGAAWDAGVVTLKTGAVRWLNLTPQLAPLGRAAQWRSNQELVMIVRAPGDLPLELRRGRQGPARITAAWRTMASGAQPAATVLGSGRFLPTPTATGALVRITLGASAIEVLAHGDFEDLEIAPDGRQVALVELGAALQPRPDRLIWVADATRKRGLTLLNLDTLALAHPCPTCDLAPLLLSWSPHGDQVLIYARQSDQDWAQGALWRVGATNARRLTTVQTPLLSYTSEGLPYAHAAWFDDDPIVLAHAAPGGGRADWYRLGRDGPINLTGLLQTPPLATGGLGPDGLLMVADGAVWRIDGRGVVTAMSSSGDRHTIIRPALGDGFRLLVNPPRPETSVWTRRPKGGEAYDHRGWQAQLALPPDAEILTAGARQLITLRRDGHGVETLGLVTPHGPPRDLLALNGALAATEPAEIVPIRQGDLSGEPLTSWLYLPRIRLAGAKLPLAVLPYPGAVYSAPPPAYGLGAASLQTNPEVLAAHGYAALVPSLPRAPASRDPAAGLADQILTVVDAAIATGVIDPNRLVIFGHSFGGYAALTTATQTDRFKAVIAKAAVTDIAALRGALIPHDAAVPEDGYELNFGTGWSELGQGHLQTDPTHDPERYRRNSPLAAAERITSPVLLIAGDRDEVPISQSQAMFAALYRQGKDAELVTYWGERHLIASPANLRDLYARVFAWLALVLPANPSVKPLPSPVL